MPSGGLSTADIQPHSGQRFEKLRHAKRKRRRKNKARKRTVRAQRRRAKGRG